MPPTIILTVGRLAAELAGADPPPLPAALPVLLLVAGPPAAGEEALLLPDEHAATVSAVALATARAARERLLRPILCIGVTPLLRCKGKEKRIGEARTTNG
jgi:hypothetical protein